MIIKRRDVKAVTFRVTNEMRRAIGTEIIEIVLGDVVVFIPAKYDSDKVVLSLETIASLLKASKIVEAEEMEKDMKAVLDVTR